MKLYCTYTGLPISFNDYFTKSVLHRSKIIHPIFKLSLLDLSTLITLPKLTDTESILLLLAYLDKCSLVDWNSTQIHSSQVLENSNTIATIRSCNRSIQAICEFIHCLPKYKKDFFPLYRISKENPILENIEYYVQVLKNNISTIQKNYFAYIQEREKKTQEEILDLAFSTFSSATPHKYIVHLIAWLENIVDLSTDQKGILLNCASTELADRYGILLKDLEELQEFFYLELENNCTYTDTIFSLVSRAIDLQTNELGLDSQYEILDYFPDEDILEQATLKMKKIKLEKYQNRLLVSITNLRKDR